MQPEQQRIMGYFIEEAKEHLQTIEDGLLNLQAVVEEPERVNEVFRAAHSIKGGAAMLGLPSIQAVSHRLEDYFKVLKEHPVQVDQKLESLFLRGFDALSALMEQLQSSFGLSEDAATQILQDVEPVFADLGAHLTTLTGSGLPMPEVASFPDLQVPDTAAVPLAAVCLKRFQQDVMVQMRQLLQMLQQPDETATRTQIDRICQELGQLGQDYNIAPWVDLLDHARGAVVNPENPFDRLASGIIPALKNARDLVLAQRPADITTPEELLSLSGFPATPEPSSNATLDWLDFLDEAQPQAAAAGQDQSQLDDLLDGLLADPTESLNGVAPEPSLTAQLSTVEPQCDFASLEALLAEETVTADAAPPLSEIHAEGGSEEVDFADLEQLLDSSHAAAPASVGSAPKPASSSRAARRSGSVAQTLKVPVRQLDNLGNLVGELVVNRNTLEDGQDRLKQFLRKSCIGSGLPTE